MNTLLLQRETPSDIATMGVLTFGGVTLETLERPWIPTEPGGKPFESCVPAGRYMLIQHTRRNGDKVVAMVNPGLAVYYLKDDRPNGVGRYLNLLHSANWVHEIEGCIAPGLGRAVTEQGLMVTQSRKAMALIMGWLSDDAAELLIKDAE